MERFVKRVRRRHTLFLVSICLLKSLGLFLTLAGAVVLADALFGLPVAILSFLRWIVFGVTGAFFLASLFKIFSEFEARRLLHLLESRFGDIAKHDPLSNAWSFLKGVNLARSEFAQELVAREIERAANFAKRTRGRLKAVSTRLLPRKRRRASR